MASGESISNIMEFQAPTIHPNTFIWNIENINMYGKFASDFFQFCRYTCHLCIERIWWHSQVTISLHGYPAPCTKKYLCHYSLILKSKGGEVLDAISEKVYVDEKSSVVLYSSILGSDRKRLSEICISWNEVRLSEISLQIKSTQTESERSTNVLEQWTQTEEIQLSPMKSTRTETENENYRFLEILSKEFGSFYEEQSDHDCLLKVGETKFAVHRSVLAARCPVFAAMFHHDTLESRNGEVDIPDVDAAILNDVLYYIYSGKIRGLSSDTAAAMYEVADKYSLIDLRDKCLEYLLYNLTVGNVCDAAVLSHTHAEEKLEKEVIQFIKLRLQELMESEKWKRFSSDHSLIANRLLCSALLASQTCKI